MLPAAQNRISTSDLDPLPAGFNSPARYSSAKAARRAGSQPAQAGRRVESAPEGLADLAGDFIEQIVGRPAIRLGLKVQDDSVAQGRQQERANIFHADVEPPVQ